MTKAFGSWSEMKDVLASFQDSTTDYDKEYDDPTRITVKSLDGIVPIEEEILFASYGGAAYEGHAVVLFKKEGKLYEAGGSHCSCNGLEGQWSPTETTWEAQALRLAEMEKALAENDRYGNFYNFLRDHEDEAQKAYVALVKSNLPSPA